MRIALGLLLCCTLGVGCDADRLAKLEKENADLKAKVKIQDAAVNYELQSKCSKDARVWFNENWSRDKNTILLDFTNHYNVKQNKCFILVEHHFNTPMDSHKGTSWANDMDLYDVQENAKYAAFLESHDTYYSPTIHTEDSVALCDVQQSKCKTGEEFNKLMVPYMND